MQQVRSRNRDAEHVAAALRRQEIMMVVPIEYGRLFMKAARLDPRPLPPGHPDFATKMGIVLSLFDDDEAQPRNCSLFSYEERDADGQLIDYQPMDVSEYFGDGLVPSVEHLVMPDVYFSNRLYVGLDNSGEFDDEMHVDPFQ